MKAAIGEAFAAEELAIVDAVIVLNELPNLPHLNVETIENVAVAKIKEAIRSVMGS